MLRHEHSETPETTKLHQVWIPHFDEPITGVVLCIRSAVTSSKFEYGGTTLKKGVSQPTDYAPVDAYVDALYAACDEDLWIDAVPSPPSTLFSVTNRVASIQSGLTLCVVEATTRVPPFCCLSLFDQLHRDLTNQRLDHRSVMPVLIVDPLLSHSNFLGLKENDGPRALMDAAARRGLCMVQTDIANTRRNFAQFIAQKTFQNYY